ncbi:unnamed protein product, partial [Amoebophrya sp. A25]|eukprot:GSA25T00016245001.1
MYTYDWSNQIVHFIELEEVVPPLRPMRPLLFKKLPPSHGRNCTTTCLRPGGSPSSSTISNTCSSSSAKRQFGLSSAARGPGSSSSSSTAVPVEQEDQGVQWDVDDYIEEKNVPYGGQTTRKKRGSPRQADGEGLTPRSDTSAQEHGDGHKLLKMLQSADHLDFSAICLDGRLRGMVEDYNAHAGGIDREPESLKFSYLLQAKKIREKSLWMVTNGAGGPSTRKKRAGGKASGGSAASDADESESGDDASAEEEHDENKFDPEWGNLGYTKLLKQLPPQDAWVRGAYRDFNCVGVETCSGAS